MQNCWGILLITASLKFATNTAQEAFLHCVCVQCCPCGPCFFLLHMPQKIQLDWLFCCFLSGCLGQEADVWMGCWGCQRCQRKECVYFMLRWYWVIKPTCSWKTLAKWRMNQKVPLFQQSWKWKMAPLETKLTLQGPIFHFHDLREDYGCVTQPHARGTVFFPTSNQAYHVWTFLAEKVFVKSRLVFYGSYWWIPNLHNIRDQQPHLIHFLSPTFDGFCESSR